VGLGYFVLKHTKFHKYIIDSDGNSDRILAVVVVALIGREYLLELSW
jgi:hypothetical protein